MNAATDTSRPIHTLILDTGPLILNTPPISSLLAQSHQILTTPLVPLEIRDQATRARFDTTVRPFVACRRPGDASLKFVREFTRRTGDLGALSGVDVEVLALTYEVECERNGGDWRLRRVPGQRRTNGAPPRRGEDKKECGSDVDGLEKVRKESKGDEEDLETRNAEQESHLNGETTEKGDSQDPLESNGEALASLDISDAREERRHDQEQLISQKPTASTEPTNTNASLDDRTPENASSSSDSDSEGWITPLNIKQHQSRDADPSTVPLTSPQCSNSKSKPKDQTITLSAALLTTDFAMQNVALLMNLNLLSSSSSNLHRIRHLRSHILRCHACFLQVKDTTRQFCPRCGKPTLTKVSCTVNDMGETKLHLKRNMQWNTRGDRYSVPKPVAGSASGKWQGRGGGKGGWGQGLILAEDQKEYVRSVDGSGRRKEKDWMDVDTLPSILTGERSNAGRKPRIGAGRNVNSRKR